MLSFMIIPVDINDKDSPKVKNFVKKVYSKLIGNNGYIYKELYYKLYHWRGTADNQSEEQHKNSLMNV